MTQSQKIKKKLFDVLVDNGNTPSKLEKIEYILSKGLKFSKKDYFNVETYYVEDTTIYNNYYPIENMAILKALLSMYSKEKPKDEDRPEEIRETARIRKKVEGK
jgi:hypothetical protein